MKKIYIILLITTVLSACNDQLDLRPVTEVETATAIGNDANIKKALLGAYDGLSGYNATIITGPQFGDLYGGQLQLFSELLASDDEIAWTGTFNQLREVFGKLMLVNNAYITANWTGGYYTINICNNILEGIDKVLPADQQRVRAEALFIRGVVYFELVRFFAKPYSAGNVTSNLGVPILLKPTQAITPESLAARATVEAVYQQVLSDLTTAEGLLPVSNGVFATKGAAAAMLSRVYLQMANYAGARDAANRVIASDEYELTTDYADAFNNEDNSVEDIFAMQVNSQDGNNNMHTFWSVPDFGGRDGDVAVNAKHLNLYEAGDARLDLFYEGNGDIRSGKWKLQYMNIPIVRLAEMYLTRAEANFRLGTAVGDTPLNDINTIRDRVHLPDLGAVTLASILRERKLELAHEGSAIHDLKRLRGSADGIAYDANRMVFPIPVREVNANKNLVQNDGYGAN